MSIKRKIIKLVTDLRIDILSFRLLNHITDNNYIRIVNYHHTPLKFAKNFEKQLKWYSANFESCGKDKLMDFLNGDYTFKEKPGLIISFDDGFEDNYLYAKPLLSKLGIQGFYMVSAGLIGNVGYMNVSQLKEILFDGGEICNHTFTHHRMNETDDDETFFHEIYDSKKEMQKLLGHEIDIFCWCGGEEKHYVKKAYEHIIMSGHKLSMTTNCFPVLQDANKYKLERTNIETWYPLSFVRFYLCGMMDVRMSRIRNRVNKKLGCKK